MNVKDRAGVAGYRTSTEGWYPHFMEEMMKQLIAVVCLVLASPLALAQDKAKDVEKKAPVAAERSAKGGDMKKEPAEKQKAQQERMKDCSGKAGERKGDERKKFMSGCLKKKAA